MVPIKQDDLTYDFHVIPPQPQVVLSDELEN